MEIIEVIKYFAKFPDKLGVLENFKTVSADPKYTGLKNHITALPDPLLPEIKDFVIGADETKVSERIRNIENYFLFLEYGPINANPPDKVRIRDIRFNLAVHVCYHSNRRNTDPMEEAVIMDNCLEKAFFIAKQMIADDNLIIPHARFVESAISFAPVEPAFLYQSIGWSLSFKKSNNLEL